ncbi:stationary phase survival protein SurE [Actinobacillus equuli]|nr:stationary phase survival protein SurE [Actinobacillus equuli]
MDLLPKVQKGILPARQILNINVPDVPYEQVKGVMVTRLGHRSPAAEIVKREDPRGSTIYWLGANGVPVDASEGTDFYALEHDYVSITPIQADMTAHYSIQALEDIF